MKTWLLGRSSAFSQATRNDLPVFPLMLENESFLAGILGGKNVGTPKYRCHICGRRSRENPTPNAYPEARREEILHAYQERSSLRGLTRTFGVSRATVSSWIKKK